ncbi:Uncharacterised protein [Mycobacteroides abscessus subsp. abscessus]|nr:Uncharacterised protein [Mycobacteroides abscessus subsp. abscessus]
MRDEVLLAGVVRPGPREKQHRGHRLLIGPWPPPAFKRSRGLSNSHNQLHPVVIGIADPLSNK